MAHRLVVNPGTSQAWEFQLKPGPNRIGRGEQNDVRINHPSVSTVHCEIDVTPGEVRLKDLGSTNGTFADQQPVSEVQLRSGQLLQLGSVGVLVELAQQAEPTATPVAAPPPPIRVSVTLPAAQAARAAPLTPVAPTAAAATKLRIGISKPAESVESSPPPALTPAPPVVPSPPVHRQVGPAFCKFHSRTPARFFCSHCNKYFCDLCVNTRASHGGPGKFCRTCGHECEAVQVQAPSPGGGRGFYSRLPGAFVYPFRGFGVLILIVATIAFSALNFVSGGLFGIFVRIALYGFVFLFMQNIIHTTTSDEKEPLTMPGADDFGGAFVSLAGTIVVSFGLAIGLVVARFFDAPIPAAAIIAATILGCLYFPMAFLAVAMKDSVMAANPLVVIPTILKIPLEYLVTSLLLLSVFGVRMLGNMMSGLAGGVSLSTRDMSVLFMFMGIKALWAFASVYLLTVSMRILGLLYVAKKHKFGWFSR